MLEDISLRKGKKNMFFPDVYKREICSDHDDEATPFRFVMDISVVCFIPKPIVRSWGFYTIVGRRGMRKITSSLTPVRFLFGQKHIWKMLCIKEGSEKDRKEERKKERKVRQYEWEKRERGKNLPSAGCHTTGMKSRIRQTQRGILCSNIPQSCC